MGEEFSDEATVEVA